LYSSLEASIFLPAAVSDGAARLRKKQAGIGAGGKDAAAAPFLEQVVVIENRVEAEQRQAETVLTLNLAVAAARVAAEFRKYRHHVVREVDRQRMVHVLGRDRHFHAQAVDRRDDLGRTIGERHHATFGRHANHLRVADGEGRDAGDIDITAIGPLAGEEQLRRIVGAAELKRRGERCNRGDRRLCRRRGVGRENERGQGSKNAVHVRDPIERQM
jgi:hypothetical protein